MASTEGAIEESAVRLEIVRSPKTFSAEVFSRPQAAVLCLALLLLGASCASS